MNELESIMRRKNIYRLRKKGLTYSRIAELHGISTERARQLFVEAEYAEEILPTLPLLIRKLSTRTRTYLRNHFGGDDIFYHPERLARMGGNQLHRIKNVGRITLREIGASLHEMGFIDCIESWIEQ